MESVREMRLIVEEDILMVRIILIVGDQESVTERELLKIAEELKITLSSFFEVSIETIDKNDILKAASQIMTIIRDEDSKGFWPFIYLNSNLRTMSIAAYISGCLRSVGMLTEIPKYDKDNNEIGIEPVKLPILPFVKVKSDLLDILVAIGDGVKSLDDLVRKLNPKIKDGSQEFSKERSRISHHIKYFNDKKWLKKKKSGKNIQITLTQMGEIMRFSAGLKKF